MTDSVKSLPHPQSTYFAKPAKEKNPGRKP